MEYGDDSEVLRVLREVPVRPAAPLDHVALVAELWGEQRGGTKASNKTPHSSAEF